MQSEGGKDISHIIVCGGSNISHTFPCQADQAATVPSKLLTSTMTHNFDRGVPKGFKNFRNFRDQERHPLSKAFKFEKCLEMTKKNYRQLLLLVFLSFSCVGFSLSKLDFKNAFSCYISS
jgi:hypothetical protein